MTGAKRFTYRTSIARHSGHLNYEGKQAAAALLATVRKAGDGLYQHDRRAQRVSVPLRNLGPVQQALEARGHTVIDREQLDLYGWPA